MIYNTIQLVINQKYYITNVFIILLFLLLYITYFDRSIFSSPQTYSWHCQSNPMHSMIILLLCFNGFFGKMLVTLSKNKNSLFFWLWYFWETKIRNLYLSLKNRIWIGLTIFFFYFSTMVILLWLRLYYNKKVSFVIKIRFSPFKFLILWLNRIFTVYTLIWSLSFAFIS